MQVIDNHPASQWETHLLNTPENNALIEPGKQLSPSNLIDRITNGGLYDVNPEVIFQTDASILADEGVRAAMSTAGVELPFWKQVAVLYQVVIQNPVVKAIGYVKSGIDFIMKGVDFLSGDSNEAARVGATNNINYAQNAQVAGTSSWISPNRIIDNVDGATQCTDCIPPWRIYLATIHVIDTDNNNMYSLKGIGNDGITYPGDGYVYIDDGGTTAIDVAGKGSFITDIKNQKFLLLGGTHTYYGIGTQDVDTYVSNSVVAHLNSDALFDATKDKSGDEFGKISLKRLTGAIIYQPLEGKLSLSFDHFTLPNYQNAIDLGKTAEGYQLLARGFGDMVLLGNEKFFPLLVRNFLKGDSAIIFNKDVKVINTYVARDNSYDYIIKADNESTKVIARNQKIIQESSGLDLELTQRQRNLIYATD